MALARAEPPELQELHKAAREGVRVATRLVSDRCVATLIFVVVACVLYVTCIRRGGVMLIARPGGVCL